LITVSHISRKFVFEAKKKREIKNLTFSGISTYLAFDLDILGNFFHQIGIEWMKYLNTNSCVEFYSFSFSYLYPDQDFCIFAHFPVNKSIFLTLEDTNVTTLTYAWLCKNGNMNMSSPSCGKNINWTKINAKLDLCKIIRNESNQKQNSNAYSDYSDLYQIRLVRMLFIEIVPFVLIPCACFIGLFFNWKIIQTINKNKKQDMKEDFYKYMSANAKFNCLYCLICVFYPMNSCTWRLSYYFCSSIFTTQIVQYYKIIMISYFGEVVKMCANVSYLMMTLNRYLLVGKDHLLWLVTLAKLEFKWVIRGSLLFSALINIGHGWEYQAIENQIGRTIFLGNLNPYDFINGDSYSDYPQANQQTPFFIYSVMYFCINFGVFFMLNTGLEVKIVRRMQKELRAKRERLAKMNAPNSALKTSSVRDEKKSQTNQEDKKKLEEDSKKERKVIKMVVLNGFFNFVLRAPEMVFWIENCRSWPIFFGFTISNHQSTKFTFPGILNLLADVGYFAYILTFSSNFLIFYKFNKNFRKAVVLFRTK
jgi:hypothetical protein